MLLFGFVLRGAPLRWAVYPGKGESPLPASALHHTVRAGKATAYQNTENPPFAGVDFFSFLVTKENPRLCRGEKKAYGEGRSRQEKVSELE